MREKKKTKNNKDGFIDWDKKETNQLLNAILSLESKDEAKRFLRDLMTEGEIEEFARRLEAARMLSRNSQYALIIEQTGLSSTTVARISKWLKGSLGGYRIVLNRINPSTKLGTSHHHNSFKLEKGLSLHS
jgi:TrpR-related protein YerC/YecD